MVEHESYLNELERAITGRDLAILRSVISQHSQSCSCNDLLADALVISCDQGHHEAVHFLLAEEKAKANATSKNARQAQDTPPLILAVKRFEECFYKKPQHATGATDATSSTQSTDFLRIIDLLLKHGVALTALGTDKRNALFHVLSAEVAELVLSQQGGYERHRALKDLKDNQGNDALMSAIVNDECEDDVALNYIKHGADMQTVDEEGRTTLMNAAWKKRTPVVKRLLESNLFTTIAKATDIRGRNIWHHIASDRKRTQFHDIVDLFLTVDESHASVNAVDTQGHTSLHLSAKFGTLVVAKKFFEKRAPAVNATELLEKRTALHFAAAEGNAAFIDLLLKNGANRLTRCDGGFIPLHLVCGCEHDPVAAVSVLLDSEAGRQLECRKEDKMTPLHVAASHGNFEIVEHILDLPKGSEGINARCEGGWTALHLACGRHMLPAKQPLPTSDSIEQSKTTNGGTATLDGKYLAVVKALLSHGADVNRKSQLSRTALHIAAEMGHVEIVRHLIKQDKIQFSAKDSRGNTPLLDAAKSKESDQILRLLAPWNKLSIRSLPDSVKRAAQDYDANIIDFQKDAGTKMQRHKIPVYNVLYQDFEAEGNLGKQYISTRPNRSKGAAFRWIHLPANNLHWCHTLLTKHFIEGGFADDVESFKTLERSLSQQQHRGRQIHSRFMRPACTKLVRRSINHHHRAPSHNSTDDPQNGNLKAKGRVNSTQVAEIDSAPPSPEDFTIVADRDLRGLQPQDSKTHLTFDAHAHIKVSDSPLEIRATIDQVTQEVASLPAHGSGAYLFLPYLTLERSKGVKRMHEQLLGEAENLSSHDPKQESQASEKVVEVPLDRDGRLHKSYSEWTTNEYCLHVRRTLDQFWYRNVDTRERDGDQVVQRYQKREIAKSKRDADASLMVDQLWIWILGPSLIVTSFPQDWQQPRDELPDLLSSILEEIDARTGTPVNSVYDLAACIVGHCLSSCDQTADQSERPSVLEMFGSSVGNAMNREVKLFSRFKAASVTASDWVKCTLLADGADTISQTAKFENQYAEDVKENDASKLVVSEKRDKKKGRGRTATDEPTFVEDLLDIHDETTLLEEVKDIQDELGILLQVVEDQRGVHKEIIAAFQPMLTLENEFHQLRSMTILDEHRISLDQQKVEIDNMMLQVKSTYKSITDLLDHKQKHANAIEARFARKQQADTSKQGRTLMVFTIVTVIFLPLSFLAAFFAINIDALPHNAQNELSLGFILKYVVVVGLCTALAFVILSLYHHKGWRFIKKKYWALCDWKSAARQKKSGAKSSSYASSSSASSTTLRLRSTSPQHDVEKGGSSVS